MSCILCVNNLNFIFIFIYSLVYTIYNMRFAMIARLGINNKSYLFEAFYHNNREMFLYVDNVAKVI